MKIRIVIPLWKRPEVTIFCFDELVKLIQASKHEIEVTCVISEEYFEPICFKYGFETVWAENDPLGAKINAGIEKALSHEFDYLMMMNSDDVIDVKLIDEVYQPFFDRPFFGIDRVTYVNFYTGEAVNMEYKFSCLGIGKMMRRDMVERAMKVFKKLYTPHLNRCMDDTMMDNVIRTQGIMPVFVKYEGQLAWDFKSDTNIWPWEKFKDKPRVELDKRFSECFKVKSDAESLIEK